VLDTSRTVPPATAVSPANRLKNPADRWQTSQVLRAKINSVYDEES
jgi:hypothetical protein